MSPEAVILMILTCSLVMGTTAGKAISKGLGVLESLWKLGWAGYRDFPDSFSHLDGVHVNHHSWRESGPVPLGLPIEGILERKDHPYHQLVKLLTNSKAPIGTHLVDGFPVTKGGSSEEKAPILHTFHEDRQYGQVEAYKFANQPPSPTFTQALSLIDANSLSNYLASGENYMLPAQHPDLQLPSPQNLHSIASFAPSMSSLPLSTLLLPAYDASDSLGQEYPIAMPGDPLLSPMPSDQEVDTMQTMLAIHPLPVYAPIGSRFSGMSNSQVLPEGPGAYENDESFAAASTQTTLTEDSGDSLSSSSNTKGMKENESKPGERGPQIATSSDDLVADEDRQLRK